MRGRVLIRAGAAAACLLILVVAACRPARERAPVPAPPHILLISLDACRADRLSCYGYERPTSPFLDTLASRGTRFALAFANTQGTVPSHTTLLTSLPQETHRMFHFRTEEEKRWQKVPDGAVMLQELLRARGYRTLAVTDGGHMARVFGYDRGFDDYRDGATGVESGTRKLLGLIRALPRDGTPVFAFLHTYEIHSPYDPPEPERSLFGPSEGRIGADSGTLLALNEAGLAGLSPQDLEFLRGRYDGGIRFTDRVLEGFFRELEAEGFLPHAVVAVTADHGEEFADHGGLLHRNFLYEELLRVPLILAGPGVPAGRVEEKLAGLVDLSPTLLALAGTAPKVLMEGRDLLDPAFRGEVLFAQYGNLRYALRTRQWKYIRTTVPEGEELFDLVADPGEKNNAAAVERERARRFSKALEEWRRARPDLGAPIGKVALTPEHEKQLRALGYIQ